MERGMEGWKEEDDERGIEGWRDRDDKEQHSPLKW